MAKPLRHFFAKIEGSISLGIIPYSSYSYNTMQTVSGKKFEIGNNDFMTRLWPVCGDCLAIVTSDKFACVNNCGVAVIQMSTADLNALMKVRSENYVPIRNHYVISSPNDVSLTSKAARASDGTPFVIFPPREGKVINMVTVCSDCLEIVPSKRAYCKRGCGSLGLYIDKLDLEALLQVRRSANPSAVIPATAPVTVPATVSMPVAISANDGTTTVSSSIPTTVPFLLQFRLMMLQHLQLKRMQKWRILMKIRSKLH
jgi:hypothetical protein